MSKRWWRNRWAAMLFLAATVAFSPGSRGDDFGALFIPSLVKKGFTESLLEVTLNGQITGKTLPVLRRGGRLYMDREDLAGLRISLPKPKKGEGSVFVDTYLSLGDIPGLSYQIDRATLTLHLNVQPGSFIRTDLMSEQPSLQEPFPSGNGFFFNYDGVWEHTQVQDEGSLLGEIGVFSKYGLLLGNFIARTKERSGERAQEAVRLETVYTLDFPEKLQTLRVGDSISKSDAMWGNSVRFGGLQWGSNFATQPELITTPQLAISAQARLPSTADLYVNNILKQRLKVDQGPFSISHIPALSGAGEMQLVITDILGREEVVTLPFYSSPTLLRPGLSAYSAEIGVLREEYAVKSNVYGGFVGAGTYRLGLSRTLTLGLHAEGTTQTQAAGISGNALWSDIGMFSAAVAASRSKEESGALGSVGFNRAASPFSIGARVSYKERGFSSIGENGANKLRLEGHFSLSYATQKLGALSGALLYRDYWEKEDAKALTLGYRLRLGRWGSFGATMQHAFVPEQRSMLLCYVSFSLGERTSANAQWEGGDGGSQTSFSLHKSLPTGSGSGYRLQGDFGVRDRLEAGYDYQNMHGTYHATAVRSGNENAFRFGASGGVAYLDDSFFHSRRIDQSFAVVEVGDFEEVPIYQDNQLTAKTDADGRALIPRLRAYQKNPIRIETVNLPLDVVIPTFAIDAVPGYRQGIKVLFPVRQVRQAVMRVVEGDGSPLPAGAAIGVKTSHSRFPVGLQGRVYLSDLDPISRIEACWEGHCCEFTLHYPETDDPLPDLGTQICEGVLP